MNIEKVKGALLRKGLISDDFFTIKGKQPKIIVRRTGIDKIEKHLNIHFTLLSVIPCSYGDKMAATVSGTAIVGGGIIPAYSSATANPDNMPKDFHNYAEIAEKRCRHRLILKLADLYELDVYSEEESEDFRVTSQDGSRLEKVVSELNTNYGNR